MNRQDGFNIDKDSFRRPLPEIFAEGIKLVRGMFVSRRFDACGPLFRAGRDITILKKNGSITIGRKVQFYRGVKLSAWGGCGCAEIIIGDNTSIGDRTEIHAGSRVEVGSRCDIS